MHSGFKHTITLVFTTLLRFFGARRVVLVVREKSADLVFNWEAGRSADGSARDVRFVPLEIGTFSTYMVAPAAAAWHAVAQRGSAGRFDIVALDREGSPLSFAPMTLPHDFVAAIGPFQELIAFSIELGDEWIGRAFLVDPIVRANRAGVLGSGLRIVRQIGPAVQNVYLMHRLRRAAAAVERKHIARELHDGAIQTVSAVEMQVAALGIRLGTESPVVAAELRRLDGVLREEVLRLRELMQQMRPLDIRPEQLVESLGEFVQRFQRETGISARFVTQLDCVPLTPRACREVSRILLEALTNIRRHSGARNVVVRLTSVDGDCRLSIDDDGRGFPFVGRLSQADLEAGRKGPLVIRERVRLLGGHLTIDSAPGRGARLEIAVPFTSHAI